MPRTGVAQPRPRSPGGDLAWRHTHGRISMDTPADRLPGADEENLVPESDGLAADIPAGAAGADSGAVGTARIDPDDEARLQNISSQNDLPGVGTRAADGLTERDSSEGGSTSRHTEDTQGADHHATERTPVSPPRRRRRRGARGRRRPDRGVPTGRRPRLGGIQQDRPAPPPLRRRLTGPRGRFGRRRLPRPVPTMGSRISHLAGGRARAVSAPDAARPRRGGRSRSSPPTPPRRRCRPSSAPPSPPPSHRARTSCR